MLATGLWAVDLASKRISLVKAYDYQVDTPASIVAFDMAWNPADGMLYAIGMDLSSAVITENGIEADLGYIRIDPATGDGTTLLNASNENGLDGWAVSNTEIWTWKTYNGASYLNGSAFNLTLNADAWAVSPKLTVGTGNASVSFEHAGKFQDAGLRTLCTINVRETGTTEWTKLNIPTWPEAGAWTFVSCGAIDLSAYAGKTVEIGFCYGKGCTDTWEIRNLTFVNATTATE